MTKDEEQQPKKPLTEDKPKKRWNLVWIIIIIIVNVLIFSSLAIVVFDIKFPILNPTNPPTRIPFSLLYPPPHGVVSPVGDVYIEVHLYANGTIVDGKPVLLTAVGSLSDRLSKNVDFVAIGFEGALPYAPDMEVFPIGPAFGSVTLTPYYGNADHPHTIGLKLSGPDLIGKSETIQWTIQGDYSPTIVIWFSNYTYIEQTYPNIRIPVSSASLLQEERFNRENLAISFALLGFEVIASMILIKELRRET